MLTEYEALGVYGPMLEALAATRGGAGWPRGWQLAVRHLLRKLGPDDALGPMWWAGLAPHVAPPLKRLEWAEIAAVAAAAPAAAAAVEEWRGVYVWMMPIGGPTGGPQQQMLDYIAFRGGAGLVPLGFDVAWSDSTTKGYTAVPWRGDIAWMERVPPARRNFYHLVHKGEACPLYIDVDVHLSNADNALVWSDAAKNAGRLGLLVDRYIPEALERWKGSPLSPGQRVARVYTSSDAGKISWHVLWPGVVFADNEVMKAFIHHCLLADSGRRVRDEWRDPFEIMVRNGGTWIRGSAVDHAIYTKHRLFRLMGSTKSGQMRPMVPAAGTSADIFDSFLFAAPGAEVLPLYPATTLTLPTAGPLSNDPAVLHEYFAVRYPYDALEQMLDGGFDGHRALSIATRFRGGDEKRGGNRWIFPKSKEELRARVLKMGREGQMVTRLDVCQRHATAGVPQSPVVFRELCIDIDAPDLSPARPCVARIKSEAMSSLASALAKVEPPRGSSGALAAPSHAMVTTHDKGDLCKACWVSHLLPIARTLDAFIREALTDGAATAWFFTGNRGVHGWCGDRELCASPLMTTRGGREYIVGELLAAIVPLGKGTIDAGVTAGENHMLRAPFSMHNKTGRLSMRIDLASDTPPF